VERAERALVRTLWNVPNAHSTGLSGIDRTRALQSFLEYADRVYIGSSWNAPNAANSALSGTF
jgi:hypothetical protein